jgi:hypothetical protein
MGGDQRPKRSRHAWASLGQVTVTELRYYWTAVRTLGRSATSH